MKRRMLLLIVVVAMSITETYASFWVDNLLFVIGVNDEARVTGFKSDVNLGIVTIPSVVQYEGKTYDVTEIDDKAFSGCKTIEYVTIPVTVKSIGEGAFNGCEKLVYAEIEGLGLQEIGAWAFANSGLLAISVPISVTKMDGNTFRNCTNLTTLVLGTGLTKIPAGMCRGCESLISIHFPLNVTYIGDNAFQDCDLHTVEIPAKVTYIGWEVFKGNKNFTKVTSLIEEPYNISSDNFEQVVYENTDLYVPVGTFELYQKKDGWKLFRNMKEVNENATGVSITKSVTPKVVSQNSIDGRPSTGKGLTVIRMNDGSTKKIVKH